MFFYDYINFCQSFLFYLFIEHISILIKPKLNDYYENCLTKTTANKMRIDRLDLSVSNGIGVIIAWGRIYNIKKVP